MNLPLCVGSQLALVFACQKHSFPAEYTSYSRSGRWLDFRPGATRRHSRTLECKQLTRKFIKTHWYGWSEADISTLFSECSSYDMQTFQYSFILTVMRWKISKNYSRLWFAPALCRSNGRGEIYSILTIKQMINETRQKIAFHKSSRSARHWNRVMRHQMESSRRF